MITVHNTNYDFLTIIMYPGFALVMPICKTYSYNWQGKPHGPHIATRDTYIYGKTIYLFELKIIEILSMTLRNIQCEFIWII